MQPAPTASAPRWQRGNGLSSGGASGRTPSHRALVELIQVSGPLQRASRTPQRPPGTNLGRVATHALQPKTRLTPEREHKALPRAWTLEDVGIHARRSPARLQSPKHTELHYQIQHFIDRSPASLQLGQGARRLPISGPCTKNELDSKCSGCSCSGQNPKRHAALPTEAGAHSSRFAL